MQSFTVELLTSDIMEMISIQHFHIQYHFNCLNSPKHHPPSCYSSHHLCSYSWSCYYPGLSRIRGR